MLEAILPSDDVTERRRFGLGGVRGVGWDGPILGTVHHLLRIALERRGLRAVALFIFFASASLAQTVAPRYNQQLATLDRAKPESVCMARDSLRVLIPKASPAERAAMFRTFRTYYLQSVSDTEPAFWEVLKPFKRDTEDWFMQSEGPDPVQALLRSRPDIRKAAAIWFKCGFSLTEGEGDLYPAADSSTLLEFAANFLPISRAISSFGPRKTRKRCVAMRACS